jgi:hypothetical protein
VERGTVDSRLPPGSGGAQTKDTSVSSRILPFILLLASLLGGTYVRLVDLGDANFNGDELDHYYAASSLLAGDGPVLPSGNEYTRGMATTLLVSLTMGIGDDPELAARFPTALLGVLNLLLLAFVAWRMAGAWPAAVSVLLFAIYPEAIVQSRMVRFYTLQLDLGILAMFTGWMAVKDAGATTSVGPFDIWRAWLWGAVTLILFWLAARLQATTLSVALGWVGAVAVAGVADFVAHGRKVSRRSFPMQFTAIAAVAGVLAGLAFRESIRRYAELSQYVGAWSGPGSKLAYYYMLSADFPLIVALMPLIFVATAIRNLRLGAYLTLWFSIPVLLHSLLFPWKGERYILLALPALFIAAGVAATMAGGALYRWLNGRIAALGREPWAGRSRALATGVVASAGLFALVTQHAFNEARRIPPIPKPIDWEAAAMLIEEWPGSEDMPLGTSIALPALYYWERADFVVGTDFFEAAEKDREPPSRQGAPDWYGGVPMLTRPAAIRAYFPSATAIMVGIDTDRWAFNNIDPELRRTLSREAEEICQGRCGDFLLFVWPLSPARDTTRLP